jgi:glycopeptide antibiotics resistance protein
MKSIVKNWKTSLVALAGVLSLFVSLALLISKTITSSDFAVIMGAIGVFLVTLVSAFAKDGDKTGV